jgi:hypothetical protein
VRDKKLKMNIRKTIITAAVTLTTVAMIAPASVGAVTVAELQAQINALMAQLQTLQAASPSMTSGNVPAACVGVTLSRNLAVGATGSDVKCLQALLNADASTQVSATGAGSPGNETTTFGPKTLAAVQKYQAANGITPASQAGPLTRAKLNQKLGGTAMTPGQTQTVVPTGAGLTVSLASNNPASGTIVDGQALAPLAALTFWNGDNAEVKVTGLKLKRIGVSADASLTNVYLFNGATRLTDGAAVSSTMVNFNNSSGLFMVPANGSVTIWVLSNVDGTASETVGVQLVSASDVTSNASSVKGGYPLTGNLMTIATGTLAGVEWNATTTPAAASVDPQDGYTVFQNSVTVTTRAVDMNRISFKKTGSVGITDLQNFKLYIDGVQVGQVMQLATSNIDAGQYVTFDLSSAPKRLEAGTRVVKLLADIVGGSNSTFTFHLWNVADVTVVDTQYNANVLSDLASDATFSKRSTGEQTVNAGTITITKLSDSPSGDVVDAASNASLGRWQIKAAGEKVKIETLNIRVIFANNVTTGDNDTTATGDITIRNGVLLANGVQVGSTTSTTNAAAGTQFSLGSSLIVDPLSPVTLEFKGDIYDNKGSANDIDATDTLQASIVGSSSNNNATGLVSATTIDAPAANVNANVLTVRQGTLTLSKYTAYTNHTVVAPLTAYKLGHYTLTAATSEAVNLSTINVVPNAVISSYLTNLYVKYGTQTTSIKPTVTATNTWSINYSLPAGQTVDVTVYGDMSSSAISGGGTIDLDIDGTTASSAVTADSSVITGQTITFSTGTFATAFDGSPQDQIVSGNQSVFAGKFKLTSSYQNYTVKEMRFTANSNPSPISSATLKDGSTVLGTVPYDNANSYFNFTGLNISVPSSTSKRVDLYWNLAVPSATNSSWDLDTKAALTYVKYADPNGTESTDTNTRTGKSTIVYKAVPTIVKNSLTSSNIINGSTMDLYKFTVTAPSQGTVNVKQFKIDLSWNDAGTGDSLELESLKLLKDGVDITSSVSMIDEDTAASVEGTTGVTEGSSQIIVTWDSATEDTIAAGTSTTYTIRATPQGFNVAGASDTVKDGVSLQFVRDTAAQTAAYNFINEGTSLTGILKLFSSATANASAENANLIWSDESAVAHSASRTAGTGDWSNSYLFSVVDAQSWSY